MKRLALIPPLIALSLAIAPLARAVAATDTPSATIVVSASESEDEDERVREKEDQAREREDRKQERIDREEELYDEATDALDEHDWRAAASGFRKVAALHMGHGDGALYWLAYAQAKMGQRPEALATLVELQKDYPKSRWMQDGHALEVEIRQSAGQKIEPTGVDDEDIKLMAVNGLLTSDPNRAIPFIEELLKSPKQSRKVKDRALFVLSQSSTPRAKEILAETARNSANPDMQARAIRYLGIMGGESSRALLGDIYTSSSDVKLKKSILRSYMVSGDRARLLALARSEPNVELRADAISQIGILGGRSELADLYASESSVELRKKIIQAMFIGGNADKLAEIARGEKVSELRVAAIHNIGLLAGPKSSSLLLSLYDSDPSPEVRKAVVNGLFLQGNAKALVELARKEKDREMKKEIVSKLSVMGSKEANELFLDILK
jgi:hypothetical protein